MIDDEVAVGAELSTVNTQLRLLKERAFELRARRNSLQENQRCLLATIRTRKAARKNRPTRQAWRALILRIRPMPYSGIARLLNTSPSGAQHLVGKAVFYIRSRKRVPVHHELIGDNWVATSCSRDALGGFYFCSNGVDERSHRPICKVSYGERSP